MGSNGNGRRSLTTAGGVLSILAGIFQISNGAVLVAFSLSHVEIWRFVPGWSIPLLPGYWADYWNRYYFTYDQMWLTILWVLFLGLGILAIAGGSRP